MKKPEYVSHYLVLKDLIDGVDVRQYNDTTTYLTSRIENIKLDIKEDGLVFMDNVWKEGKYAPYKVYILKPTADNLNKAKKLLKRYATDEVLSFLEQIEAKLEA